MIPYREYDALWNHLVRTGPPTPNLIDAWEWDLWAPVGPHAILLGRGLTGQRIGVTAALAHLCANSQLTEDEDDYHQPVIRALHLDRSLHHVMVDSGPGPYTFTVTPAVLCASCALHGTITRNEWQDIT